MSGGTLLTSAYRAASSLIGLVGRPYLQRRVKAGKEDPERLDERTGIAGKARPPGPLAWLHGASVGESLALLPLVQRLRARGLHVLVTTGTVTSARILAQRLPAGAIHQYAPLDAPAYIRRFLDHWQPDILLLAESELWPNMLFETAARHIPLIMVNARLSERSMRRWQKAPKSIAALLGCVDLCLAQSEPDAQRYFALGAQHVQVTGNLKYDVPAPPADAALVAELSAIAGARPLWVAASVHPGEDEIAAQVHAHLARTFPHMFTILAPRHPRRGEEAFAVAESLQLAPRLRSRGQMPESSGGFYIADTIGELGLFYRITGIVFMGKSLAGSGGQNPIEPAKFGTAILHGPAVDSFTDVYAALDAAGGAFEVHDARELAELLGQLFSDNARVRAAGRAASDVVAQFTGASGRIMQAIEPWLAARVPAIQPPGREAG